MAQTTSSRSNRKVFCILGLFNILMLLQNANCYEFKVGGSGDWSVPMDANANNYNQWAEGSRFQIGDTLSFSYSADKDSVILVNKTDFDNCNTSSPIQKYNDGHSVVKFNHSGPYYFISGVHDNCVKNEKLHLVVMADRSNKTGASSPPSPSPSADEVPPSPAPSGEEAPSPPTGSVETNPTPAPSQESSPPSPTKNGASSIVMTFVGSTAAFVGSSILLGF